MEGAARIVEATEGLYQALFSVAVGYAVATTAWGLVIAPTNRYEPQPLRGIAIGAVLLVATGAAWRYRRTLYARLRANPNLLLLAVALGSAALWADYGWRSSFYLASYLALPLAAVAASFRWSLLCGLALAANYVLGLVVHRYAFGDHAVFREVDSAVANTGGYLIAACFFALPVAWLGSYVARISQSLNSLGGRRSRTRTASLSAREVEVAQLVAAGLSNDAIADGLCLSPRTVQSHVANCLKKTAAANRAELAALTVQEGLVPLQ